MINYILMTHNYDICIKNQNYILNKNELYIKNTFIDIYNDNIIEKFNKIRKVKSLNNILNNDNIDKIIPNNNNIDKKTQNNNINNKIPKISNKTPPIQLFKDYQHLNTIPPLKFLLLNLKINTNIRKKVLLIKILEYIKFITRNFIQFCKIYNNQNKINEYAKLYFLEINYYYLYIKIFIYNLI